MITNGWISPEGKIYKCGRMEHQFLAEEIIDKKGLDAGSSYYHTLWDKGYLKFSGNPYTEKPVIDFDDNPRDVKESITEAQKMAQARLVKQFYSRDYNMKKRNNMSRG
jgi:hypothetical protein